MKMISYILCITVIGCGSTSDDYSPLKNNTGGSANDGGGNHGGVGHLGFAGFGGYDGLPMGGKKPIDAGDSEPVDAGFDSEAEACVPLTCDDYAATILPYGKAPIVACGAIDDGCGGTVNCSELDCFKRFRDTNVAFVGCGNPYTWRNKIEITSPPNDFRAYASHMEFIANKNVCGDSCVTLDANDSFNLCISDRPDGENTNAKMVVCSPMTEGAPPRNVGPYTGCGPGHTDSGSVSFEWEYYCCP